MENPSDPCSRLRLFLETFGELSDMRRKSSYVTSRDIIAQIINVPASDSASIVRSLSDILQIPTQIRKEISQVEGLDTQAFEEAVADIEGLFAELNLDADSGDFAEKISPSLLRHLQLIGAILRKDVARHALSDERREELLKQIGELLKEVQQTQLDGDFKIFILERLNSLDYALRNYQFLGTDEILTRIDQLFGGLFRQAPSISQSKLKVKIARKAAGVGAAILIGLQIMNQGFELKDHIQDLAGFVEEGRPQDEDKGLTSALKLAENPDDSSRLNG